MSKTVERTSVNVTAKLSSRAAKQVRSQPDSVPLRCLKLLASLRITVVLMALSILLVFFGTLAQVDQGIGAVLHQYFRTGLAMIPWQVFVRFGQVFFGVS